MAMHTTMKSEALPHGYGQSEMARAEMAARADRIRRTFKHYRDVEPWEKTAVELCRERNAVELVSQTTGEILKRYAIR